MKLFKIHGKFAKPFPNDRDFSSCKIFFRYQNNVKKIVELAKDQPMTGLERAIWWTEYVIRHKGAKHLRSPAIDLPLYQYLLLDIIAFLLAVLVICTYILFKLLKVVLKTIGLLRAKIKKE